MCGQDCVPNYVPALTSILCFLLGSAFTALLLLRVPRLYNLLLKIKCPRCKRCRKKPEKETSSGGVEDLPYAMTDLNNSFRELERRQAIEDNSLTEIGGGKKRYQDFQSESRKNFHKYTPIQANSKRTYPTQRGVPNEGYEYVHVTKESNSQNQTEMSPDGSHQYFILEPQTKQPMNNIRRVDQEEELQYHNPNHIYFILEPNTSKLKQIDSDQETPERMPDHVYFVLEKETPVHYMTTDMHGHTSN